MRILINSIFLVLLTTMFIFVSCSGKEDKKGSIGDPKDKDAADSSKPDTDDDDNDDEEPLPDEIGCEVAPDEIDSATIIAFDASVIPHEPEIFTVLVQSGSMTQNEATVWTYAEDNQPKRLKVWRETGKSGSAAMVFDQDVTPNEGYIKYRVSGLAPKTEYYYAFFTTKDGEATGRSLIGRFKTAFPDDCLAPLVIGGTHGTNYGKQPYKALEITSTYDLHMFIHLGDYSYNDNAVLEDRKFREEVRKEDFRVIWKKTFDDPGFRALLAATGQYIVRDDHEVCDNSCLESKNFREEIYYTGMDAMIETTPIEADGYKIWRSYKWGKTAELFLLDCRSERIPSTRETEDAIYIGREQMEWLKKSLKESDAHFKIILNSVPITLFDHQVWLMAQDRWQGYPAQREEILSFIVNEGVQNVWWLTGDFHLGTVNRVQSHGPYSSMWEIMMGPGGNDGNPIWPLATGKIGDYPPDRIIPPHQFDFFYGLKATTIVSFDPIRDNVHVLFFDAETGESLYDKKLSWKPMTIDGEKLDN